MEDAWGDAISIVINETRMSSFPESCPWVIENILSDDWLPTSNEDKL
jgi:hypothetical protein